MAVMTVSEFHPNTISVWRWQIITRSESVTTRPRQENFFVAEAMMNEAKARHIREQLTVYEH